MTKDEFIIIDIGPAHKGLVHVLKDCAAPSARLKPVGRHARRAAFYDRKRLKARVRVFIQQLRAALPARTEQHAAEVLSTVYRDECFAPASGASCLSRA